jgi:hypothetical protein
MTQRALASEAQALFEKDKSARGNASQFFVAGELCRRGYAAALTMGNTPNTDILCSNLEGTKFVHVQVKTFVPGSRTCSVGMKAEQDLGPRFFWVLGGIPLSDSTSPFGYYVVPSSIMAKHVSADYRNWLSSLGAKGQKHKDTKVRAIHLPPRRSKYDVFDLAIYRNRWDLIDQKLQG